MNRNSNAATVIHIGTVSVNNVHVARHPATPRAFIAIWAYDDPHSLAGSYGLRGDSPIAELMDIG